MNIQEENLQICNKTLHKLIPEQISINRKHDTIFKTLNSGDTQQTNLYTISVHNNTNIINQKPTGTNSSNQPRHGYFTRLKTNMADNEHTA